MNYYNIYGRILAYIYTYIYIYTVTYAAGRGRQMREEGGESILTPGTENKPSPKRERATQTTLTHAQVISG